MLRERVSRKGFIGALAGASALFFESRRASADGGGGNDHGHGPHVRPTLPQTPDVPFLPSAIVNGAREFHVTAQIFEQVLETFPFHTAQVWGYNGITPGPTAISWEGERIRFVVTNQLPEPTTVHFHGMHAPNRFDGVAGVSQTPIPPGETFVYEFTPGHAGTFAYHAHTNDGVQEMKGLDALFIVLPRRERASEHVDFDFGWTLQEFFIPGEGQPVDPMPPGGEFNTFTMNGKTRDAASEVTVKLGSRVRHRFYNASNDVHSMHQHGFDLTIVSQNGHRRPQAAQYRVTTVDLGPGNFFEVEFMADKPGKWLVHCHFPHHTGNAGMSGPAGTPVGMSRVVNVVP